MIDAFFFFTLGLLFWTFGEYALHHWYGHLMKGRNHFSREHLKHHAVKDHFASTREKVMAALPATLLTGAVSTLTSGPVNGLAFTAGFAVMYAAYEIVHRNLHVRPPRNAYGRWARKNHFAHHFNNPRKNHGITSPIWDFAFGTHDRVETVRAPERFAMRWLSEPGSLDVYPEYAKDYTIVPSRKRKEAEAAARMEEKADFEAAYAGIAPCN